MPKERNKMSGYHKITVVGFVSREPEIRTTPKGTKLAKFSVPTDVGYGEYKKTAWWNFTAWANTAKIVEQYVRKGKEVLVECEIEPSETGGPRVFTRNNGESDARYEAKVIVLKLLGKRGDSGGSGRTYTENDYDPGEPPPDIPF